jgi:hypothetical protein
MGQAKAPVPTPILVALIGETFGFKNAQEPFHRADVFTSLSGPSRPRREEIAGFLPSIGISLAGLLDPCGEGIFGLEVSCGGLRDDLGGRKTALLPIHAAINHPLHDARQLGLELFGQRFVALVGRDGDGERNEIEAAPDCLVHRLEARLMIASDDQLELRRILEEILPHEPRRNLIAACERLDSALGPAAALFRLDGGDEARAAQTCKVCRMTVNG